MSKIFNQKSLVIFFLLLAFFPYCYLAFFAQPIAEDFGFAFQFQQNNSFYELLKNSYLTMNGRYVANVFMYASPISFNSFFGYKISPILLMAMLFVANLQFIKALNLTIKFKDNVIYALTLSIIFLHNLPIISEGLYWYTGSSIYFLGIIVAIFFMTSLVFLYKGYNKYKKHKIIFPLTLSFLSCGFNEVLTLITLFLLTIFTLFLFYIKHPQKQAFLIVLLFTILFSCLMIFAPGNTFRENMYLLKGSVLNTVVMSIAQTLRFGFWWIFSIPLITASVLFYRIYDRLNEKITWLKKPNKQFRIALILLLPLIIILCVAPPYWFTGILGQHRTLNVAYFFFIIIWFLNIILWANFIKKKFRRFKIKFSQKLVFATLVAGLFFTGNGYHALIDIFSGRAKNFNAEMNKRNAVLIEAKTGSSQEIILKPIKHKPKTLFVSDITNNPAYWTNLGYNDYFDLPNTAILTE